MFSPSFRTSVGLFCSFPRSSFEIFFVSQLLSSCLHLLDIFLNKTKGVGNTINKVLPDLVISTCWCSLVIPAWICFYFVPRRQRVPPCHPFPVLVPCCASISIRLHTHLRSSEGTGRSSSCKSSTQLLVDSWASTALSMSSPGATSWDLRCQVIRALRALCVCTEAFPTPTWAKLGRFLPPLTRAAKHQCYKQQMLLFQRKRKRFTVEHFREFNMPDFILSVILRYR